MGNDYVWKPRLPLLADGSDYSEVCKVFDGLESVIGSGRPFGSGWDQVREIRGGGCPTPEDLEKSLCGAMSRSPHFITYDIFATDPSLPRMIRRVKEYHPYSRQLINPPNMIFDDASFRQQGHVRFGGRFTPKSRRIWLYFQGLLAAGADGIKTGLWGDLPSVDGFSKVHRYLMSNHNPKLYIFVAPPGFGKTSMVEELRYMGFRVLRNVTTRPYRSIGEAENGLVRSVSSSDFISMEGSGLLEGVRLRGQEAYGILKDDLRSISRGLDDYVLDIANLDSACRLKEVYPDKIRLIGFHPGRDIIGFGLEDRIMKLREPYDPVDLFGDLLRSEQSARRAISDARRRLDYLSREARKYFSRLRELDLVLYGTDLKVNLCNVLDYAGLSSC